MIPYFIISILSGFQIGWGIGGLIHDKFIHSTKLNKTTYLILLITGTFVTVINLYLILNN